MERFYEKVMPEPMSGCWLWMAGTNNHGYGKFQINRKSRYAHRVSYELNVGPIPDGLRVLHKCDTPGCVNPAHLFPGTDADNVRDMMEKGRKAQTPGEDNGNAKLTENDVRDIRTKRMNQREFAEFYGVSRANISHIQLNKSWNHVR